MLVRRAVMSTFVVAFAVAGLVTSFLLSPPLGADQSCPSGSSAAACHYPGSQTFWSILWTVGGLAFGLGFGAIAVRVLKRGIR